MNQREEIVEGELRYPCNYCDALRTKAEGGTVFTVCDACWNKRAQPGSPNHSAVVDLTRSALAWGEAYRAAEAARAILSAIRDEQSAELTRLDGLSREDEKADKLDPVRLAHRADMKARRSVASFALVPLDQAERDLREELLATALKIPADLRRPL